MLLAIDRDGDQLFDGEPALLLEHRPGNAVEHVRLEAADAIQPQATELVLGAIAAELARLVEDAHDEFGQLDGERLLGRAASLDAPFDTFDV